MSDTIRPKHVGLEIPCPGCLRVTPTPAANVPEWTCPHCRRRYVFRRCLSCHLISYVGPLGRWLPEGAPWDCVWCHGENRDFRSDDPDYAVIGDLAADMVKHRPSLAQPPQPTGGSATSPVKPSNTTRESSLPPTELSTKKQFGFLMLFAGGGAVIGILLLVIGVALMGHFGYSAAACNTFGPGSLGGVASCTKNEGLYTVGSLLKWGGIILAVLCALAFIIMFLGFIIDDGKPNPTDH